ncbi:MAG: ATP-binding protein, partial [Acidobacteriota bacterium]
DALIARMLAKRPADRPADAREVARALGELADATLRDVPSITGAASAGEAATLSQQATVARGASTARSGEVLTAHEQRLVSIVLASALDRVAERLERLRTTAVAYGGRLERIADGTTLVLFAHAGVATDHAMRAARCALAIRDVLPAAALVVASGRAQLDRLLVGEVIDRAAAALKDLASGQVALDSTTAGLLDERFVVSGDAPRLLRGMRDGNEPARTLLGRATPLVGRDRELASLEALWGECVADGVARAVLVTAPAGGGKSRLRQELVRRVLQRDERAELLIGRGDALRAGSPFALVADALRRTAGVREGDRLDEQRAGLLARVQRCTPDAERVAHLLGELAGVAFPSDASEALRAARADPVLRMDAMREAWIDWLRAECADHPVLLVLEDLHWGDRATVDYVDVALRELAQAPLLVVALARPEVRDQFPKLWSERELQEIRLPALTKKAGEKLVRDLLGEEVTPNVLQRILERSAGNAFFLEELIRAVAEGRGQALPESVLAMLQQRLDQLGPEPRRVLRAASVFGAAFWRGGVDTLLGADSKLHLATLIERELVSVAPESRIPGETEYAFRHDLVREAAYALMDDADRALGHRLAGDWLADHGYADALALAGHFSRGGDRARAAEYYARAAEQALGGNDNAAAIAHARRGLDCGVAGALSGRLHLACAEAFNTRGEHGTTTEHAAAAIGSLPPGSAAWFRAQDELFFAVGRLGEIPRAVTIVRDLVTAHPAHDAHRAQLRSIARAAIIMFRFGPPDVGATLAERAEEIAAGLTFDQGTEQRLHTLRAMAARARGEVDRALEEHERAIRSCELARNMRELGFTFLSYGGIYAEIGEHETAVPLLARGIDIAARYDVGTVAGLLHFSSALSLWHLGRFDASREHAERAIAGSGVHDRAVVGLSRFVLANIAHDRGDIADAVTQSELALERLATFPDYRSIALATRARIHLRCGEVDAAVAAATEARRVMKPQNGFQDGESFVRLCEIEALDAAGQRDAEREATTIAIARLEARASRLDDKWRACWLARGENAATLARRS